MAGRDSHPRKVRTFSSLLARVPEAVITGNPQVEVASLAYDSRRVEPGAAFIAVRGEQADGHSFLPEARERGAVALVVAADAPHPSPPPGGATAAVPDTREAMARMAAAFHGHPSARLSLVGVTGTNGKTTTALMLDSMLRAAGHRTAVLGTIEYRIGEEAMRPERTTPEAVDLQALLARAVEAGCTHAVMEVSSHAIALHRVLGCEFAAAVFTNLTPEHLDFHGDMADYLETKKRLFTDEEYLPAGRARVNAVNVDDEAGREIARAAQGRTLTYGLARGDAEARAEEIALGAEGTAFTAALPSGRLRVRMRLLGRFNVYNALAALAAAEGMGLAPEAMRRGLEEMPPVRGRFQRVPSRRRQVVVDYAHTPDGLQRALETARELAAGRVIVVFGCGGDRDRTKRPVMGRIAGRLADRCIITSDNPRREDPGAIIEEIAAGVEPEARGRCAIEPDRARAIRLAIAEAAPADLVLIAGKGHEDYQILGDRRIHFDDREEAEAALRELEEGAHG